MKLNVEKFIEGLHDYFSKELKPILSRLKALEGITLERGKDGQPGEKGLDGKDGKDGQPGEKGLDGKDGKDGQPGEKGLDGKDGKDGQPGEKGLDGKDGKDGQPGEKGLDGKDGKDGQPGEKGLDGKDGKDGQPGEKGLDGKDGASVSEADIEKIVQARVSSWALDFERRAQEILQKAIAAIPAPKAGVDGKDGVGFDELSVVQIDGKRLKFLFKGDGREKEFFVNLPVIVDAGVYAEGKAYTAGDGVTYGGSFWIAQSDHPKQAPGKSAEWRLAVKRGRDAREVRP